MFICDISMLNRLGKASLDEMLQIIDFSWREMVVLMVLEKKPGATQNFVGKFLQTDKSNVTHIIQGLETKTFLIRKTCEEDRRYKGLYLTSVSRKLLPWLHEQLRLWQEQCYQGLSQEEITIYQNLNQKIIDNLFAFSDSKI